ncbi:DNA gyrase subunit A [Dietzia sp. 179-F 9C3 NHS]|uniref:DNA gyrase subunit A n=1 Tax=Dietzia sp. 179-F 9C3 NHS TaxID=3374295 RepID=UPI00387A5673
MGAREMAGGLFEPGDDVGRTWDEAEAVLVACDDIEGVMATIRNAESPVAARRALKLEHGFTGRQAALLLTLPVLSFTRSERDRLAEGRRSRMALLADVTGRIPVVRDADPEPPAVAPAAVPPSASEPPATPPPAGPVQGLPGYLAPPPRPAADLGETMARWEAEMEGALGALRSAMGAGAAPAAAPTARTPRRSTAREPESVVLDEQIGELCDGIAELVGVASPTARELDDPRAARTRSGELLDSCGVGDETGVRTLLWHLDRTGLSAVPGLLPFVDLLSPREAFDVQATRFEAAMTAGTLGADPENGAPWVGRLWPIADRRGYGYAVHYRRGPRAGAVWAYGGGEPLHLLWDSVVDMLVELYQALSSGAPCDAAVATVVDGRVVWTNLG